MKGLPRALLAAVLLALALSSLARADSFDPKVKTTSADQAAARAALLRGSDLGPSWSALAVATPYSIKLPVCQVDQANYSSLTLSGHAEAQYSLARTITVDSDVEVYKSVAQVTTLFRLMLQPGLEGCLRFDLFKSVGTAATVGAATRLKLAMVGDHTAAYRVAVLYKVNGKQVPIDSDFLFLAKHRTVYFVSLVAPGIDSSELPSLEQRIARDLVAHARA